MLSVQMRVAFVFRVHGDGGIAQHRLGPRRRHGDELVCAGLRFAGLRFDDRVANFPQLPGHVFVLHFEIGDRGLVPRAPVHDVISAINQSFFIEADEHFAHGVRKIVVHGEVLAVPVDGGAEALHLVENRAAVKSFPFPDPLNELLAAQVAAFLAFFGEVALHHHLRGNAGVIGTGKPQGDEAAHAMPARDDVHLRLAEHMSHMQLPGHIRRRQQQREHRTRLPRWRRGDGEELFFDPIVGPARFNRARLVRLRQFVRHDCVLSQTLWGQPLLRRRPEQAPAVRPGPPGNFRSKRRSF